MDTASSRHNMIDAHVNSQRLWLHVQGLHRFKPGKKSWTEKEKWTKSHSPNQESICQVIPVGKEKNNQFSNRVHFYITHTIWYFMHTFVQWIIKIKSLSYKYVWLSSNKLDQKSFDLTPLTHRILLNMFKLFVWLKG